jgi:hypothetical protein
MLLSCVFEHIQYIYIYKYDDDEAINHINYMNPAFTRQTWPTQWVHTIPSPFPCHQQTLCPARTSATVTAKVSLRSTMLMTVKSLRNLYVYWFYVYIYIYIYHNIIYTIYIYIHTWMCHFWGLLDCVNGLHHLTPPSTSLVSMPICAGPIRLGTPL